MLEFIPNKANNFPAPIAKDLVYVQRSAFRTGKSGEGFFDLEILSCLSADILFT
jgi:hypothetical protein